MFKTETHLHTKEVSCCGHIKADEMIRRYYEKEYSTVFVSDHFYEAYFDRFPNLSWEQKIEEYLSGYYAAKIEGDKLGINVLMSAELRFVNSGNDYLLYGIDEALLKRLGEIYMMNIESFSELAKENGIFIVQAHPYRAPKCSPTPQYVDAMEICNTNPRHFAEADNQAAERTAKEYDLYVTGGSDAHREEDVGLGGIASETEIKSAEDYISLLKSRKGNIIK